MANENELKVGEWVEFGYSNTSTDRVFHAWHIERKEVHILDIRDYYRDKEKYSHWMKIQDPQPPRSTTTKGIAFNTCEWSENEDGQYDTSCGGCFEFVDSTPEHNDFKFCCYCGGVLKQKLFEQKEQSK